MTDARDRYIETALEGEIARVMDAVEGERNEALFKAAASLGGLIAAGGLTEEQVTARLNEAASCRAIPLRVEARHTIRSGIRRGKKRPRRLPAMGADGKIHVSVPGSEWGRVFSPDSSGAVSTTELQRRWQDQAQRLVKTSAEAMFTLAGKFALDWLRKRGLTEETIRRHRLGWIVKDRWARREDWGLPPERRDNGKLKGLWLPRGILIPTLDGDQVLRLKVRRYADTIRYYAIPAVPGSLSAPMVLEGPQYSWIVVESELDAILLHQEAGGLVSTVALGSAGIRPRGKLLVSLERADIILISLDRDRAGVKEAFLWWKKRFPHGQIWPCLRGKDPSEAMAKGLNLRLWVEAGLGGERYQPVDHQAHGEEHPRDEGGGNTASASPSTRDFIERGAEEEGAREETRGKTVKKAAGKAAKAEEASLSSFVQPSTPSSPSPTPSTSPTSPPSSHQALLKEVAQWPEDLREEFEERAAIMEYQGRIPRQRAEAEAYRLLAPRLGAYLGQGEVKGQGERKEQGKEGKEKGQEQGKGEGKKQGEDQEEGYYLDEFYVRYTEDGMEEIRI